MSVNRVEPCKIGVTNINEEVIQYTQNGDLESPLLRFADINGDEEYLYLYDDDTSDYDESIAGIAKDYFTRDGIAPEDRKLSQNEEGFYQVTVEAWGSKKGDNLKYANDCMSRIIANYYPDIKLYSDDYNQLMESLKQINGIEDSNLIYAGDSIILPVPVWGENEKLIGFIEPTTEEEKQDYVKEDENVVSVDFSDSMDSVYLDKNVNLEAIKDTGLYEYLKANIKFLGGEEGDELTKDHFVEFLNHIDGNYNLDNRDGVITFDEVETWFENNKIQNPNSDFFNNFTPQEVLNLLSGALSSLDELVNGDNDCLVDNQYNADAVSINNEDIKSWITRNKDNSDWINGYYFENEQEFNYHVSLMQKAFDEIINSGLLEFDENIRIDYRLMDLSDEAKELLRHLENNIYHLGGGIFLTSENLKQFFTREHLTGQSSTSCGMPGDNNFEAVYKL